LPRRTPGKRDRLGGRRDFTAGDQSRAIPCSESLSNFAKDACSGFSRTFSFIQTAIAYGSWGLCYALNSLVSSPMPSIATVTLLIGSFMDPTPSDVPQQMMSPGSSVMSCEILLTSCCALKIMSDIG
jgi:hypothetical protein